VFAGRFFVFLDSLSTYKMTKKVLLFVLNDLVSD